MNTDVEAPSLALQFAGTALALVVVLALAWVALRALSRLQQRPRPGAAEPIQVLRSTGLGAREKLVAVRYRDREYLLGVTAAGMTVIDRFPVGEPQPPRPD